MYKQIAYKGQIIKFNGGNNKVAQVGGEATNADYEILLSGTSDDNYYIGETRKTASLTYNPSTNQLKISNDGESELIVHNSTNDERAYLYVNSNHNCGIFTNATGSLTIGNSSTLDTLALGNKSDLNYYVSNPAGFRSALGLGSMATASTSSYVAKSGDTMTGSLNAKFSNIDVSKTNNNVSSTQYPTTFNILDTAGRIMTRVEGVIESSGNVGSQWYVRNYNTSGTQVAQKGITMHMDKSGTLTYNISDAANFRTALGLGTMATQASTSYLALSGGTMTGTIIYNSNNTRLSNAKALTNQGVSSPGYVVGLTDSWGSFGYTTIAQLKTTLGLGDYLHRSGGTMTGNINWNGSSGYSSGLYWKESGYGDQFKIYPQFSGSDDSNYLCIATAVGGAGTSPSLTERFKFFPSGHFQMVNGETTGMMSVGSYLNVHGGNIELRGSTNYIDFHINKSTADYTARIIESSSGKLTAYNSISNSSDERLKKDIKELDDKYLHLLDKIDAKQFRYRKGDEYLFTGFIAQEFEAGLQEAGITDLPVVTPPTEADAYYGLDYSQVTAILWKICQNQEQRIKELESTIK